MRLWVLGCAWIYGCSGVRACVWLQVTELEAAKQYKSPVDFAKYRNEVHRHHHQQSATLTLSLSLSLSFSLPLSLFLPV